MSRHSYGRRKKAGLCVSCAKPRETENNPSTAYCIKCMDAIRISTRVSTARKRQWWRFNGDCIFCSGKRKAMVTIDKLTKAKKVLKWCGVCAEKHTERQRAKRQAKKKGKK